MRDVARLKGTAPPATPAESEDAALEFVRAVDAPPNRAANAKTPRKAPALPPLVPGSRGGLDKRLAQRFKRGALAIEARLDLHGLTQAAAHRSLEAFIRASIAAERRMVLVITGQGRRSEEEGGVLRRSVPRWLAEPALREAVVAITAAQPRDGGGGALYVLLKRKRSPKERAPRERATR